MNTIAHKLLRMTTALAMTAVMAQAMPVAVPEASAASSN